MKKFIFIFCALIFVSLIAFIFIFNSEPVKFNSVTVEDKFSISIPEYLSKTDSIDASALLQYKNEKEQMFVLVYEITDTANLSLKDFFKKISDDFISRIGQATLVKYYPGQINNRNAFIGNIRGKVNETNAYYRMAVIESDKSFFEIIIGTNDNNKSQYDEDMNKIIRGFAAH